MSRHCEGVTGKLNTKEDWMGCLKVSGHSWTGGMRGGAMPFGKRCEPFMVETAGKVLEAAKIGPSFVE